MEIDAPPHARLVDFEETTKPDAEEAHHGRIAVGEDDLAISLRAFARVERDARDEECVVGEDTYSFRSDLIQLGDLGELRVVEPIRAVWRISPLRRSEGDVSDPQGDGGLRDAEVVGDVLEGEVLRPEHSGLFLFAEFAW